MYDDKEALLFLLEAKRTYQDRGMMKWTGFYLSDHTATLEKDGKRRSKINPQKIMMSAEEIDLVIQTAYTQFKRVAIQLEELDAENHYYDDIVGLIQGQNDLGIYIDSNDQIITVNVADIRNIEILAPKKILNGGEWH